MVEKDMYDGRAEAREKPEFRECPAPIDPTPPGSDWEGYSLAVLDDFDG
jgi:hypothetical protein